MSAPKMPPRDDELLLYALGELDPASSAELEMRLARSPQLREELAAWRALSTTVSRDAAARGAVPPALALPLDAAAGTAGAGGAAGGTGGLGTAGAALVGTALVALGLAGGLVLWRGARDAAPPPRDEAPMAEELREGPGDAGTAPTLVARRADGPSSLAPSSARGADGATSAPGAPETSASIRDADESAGTRAIADTGTSADAAADASGPQGAGSAGAGPGSGPAPGVTMPTDPPSPIPATLAPTNAPPAAPTGPAPSEPPSEPPTEPPSEPPSEPPTEPTTSLPTTAPATASATPAPSATSAPAVARVTFVGAELGADAQVYGWRAEAEGWRRFTLGAGAHELGPGAWWFTIPARASGARWFGEADASAAHPADVAPRRLGAGETLVVSLDARPPDADARALRGPVTDAGGAPVVRAVLGFEGPAGRFGAAVIDGYYEIDLPPGAYELRLARDASDAGRAVGRVEVGAETPDPLPVVEP